jgi:hypothetical protein
MTKYIKIKLNFTPPPIHESIGMPPGAGKHISDEFKGQEKVCSWGWGWGGGGGVFLPEREGGTPEKWP